MRFKQAACIALGLLVSHPIWAIDSDLYERYNAYKSHQQTKQVEELGRARSEANAGNFAEAEWHLEAARNMAYSPDEIRSVENLIAEERQRRERLAREERERKERLAEEERRAREAVARAKAAGDAGSTRTASRSAVDSKLNWGYDYRSLYIPPTYRARLEKYDTLFSTKYVWVMTEDLPGYTTSNLESLYFSVRLKNNSGEKKRVRYKISAREKVSISRAAGNIWEGAIFALAGAGLASWLDEDPKAGAALGAGAAMGMQHSNNRWFNKEKTFTTVLDPHEESYETGRFPVNKTLSEEPKLSILSVERVD